MKTISILETLKNIANITNLKKVNTTVPSTVPSSSAPSTAAHYRLTRTVTVTDSTGKLMHKKIEGYHITGEYSEGKDSGDIFKELNVAQYMLKRIRYSKIQDSKKVGNSKNRKLNQFTEQDIELETNMIVQVVKWQKNRTIRTRWEIIEV